MNRSEAQTLRRRRELLARIQPQIKDQLVLVPFIIEDISGMHPTDGWDDECGCWTGPRAHGNAEWVAKHLPPRLGASVEQSGSEFRVVYSNPDNDLYYWPVIG